MPLRTICVFCGSSAGVRPEYAAAAEATGRLLAERGIGVVFGGGSVGMMGAVADATLEAGGDIVGVIPHALAAREVDHPGLTVLHKVGTMHERKALMAELSDGFVALPGGLGTLEELMEVWTWVQLGIHRSPIGILNVAGYFDGLLAFIDHAVAEGFVRPMHREALVIADTPAALLDALAMWKPPDAPRWLDADEI